MPEGKVFKRCPMCSSLWATLDDFLTDGSLMLNGYQANFAELEYGLFYFTHRTDGCGTTLAVEARYFLHLNPGTRYPERKTGSTSCPGYCRDRTQLATCDNRCECAFVRDIITILQARCDRSIRPGAGAVAPPGESLQKAAPARH